MQDRVQTWALPLTCCGSLAWLLNLSEPRDLVCQIGVIMVPTPRVFVRFFKKARGGFFKKARGGYKM